MGKHKFKKLLVDGKELYVFAVSSIPKEIKKKTILIGIELVNATRKERKKYLKKK